MRDIVIISIFLVWLPLSLVRPHVGVLLLSWLSYMNPQRLTWGFVYSLPLSYVAAIVTIVAVLFSSERKNIPVNNITIVWMLFLVWISITTIFAFEPDQALEQLIKVMKINVIMFLTLILFNQKDRIHQLLWVIVISLGFYGVKGGFFTIITGGSFRVWGPAGTFIGGNNELAVALLMMIPLMFYFHGQLQKRFHRQLMLLCVILTVAAVFGTQSRGALVSILAVGIYYWLKSSKKLLSFLFIVFITVATLVAMPDSWFDRMSTISSFQTDASSMARIHAWELALNVANDQLFGGGFRLWSANTYIDYSPSYVIGEKAYVAHSIYFSILGEHGWIGLLLFLLVFWLAWQGAGQLVKQYRESQADRWISDLASMLQVSLVAYLAGGAFLSLSYFDLPWHVVIIIVLLKQHAGGQLEGVKNKIPTGKDRP